MESKWVIVSQYKDGNGVMQVNSVFGPFPSKDDAIKARDTMNFPSPEYCLIKGIYG